MEPQLEAADEKSDLFGLRKIDIKNWRSPVAQQYRIRSIPTCMIYDPEGQLKISSSQACWMVANQPDQIQDLE
ncbi:hypothetical protein ACFL27_06730 [candidate division CSSED10-310 bacterium]|uniref:Thioredoxin-like fold domain-containing protein n=1 Tax=candidate division CSSED10-310 bacterium TaxID=2855610 RepID=A0ABV6YUM7_UNCC1